MGHVRKDRKIYPDEHADSVRLIYDKYIELKSNAKVKHWLDENNIKSQYGNSLSTGNVNSILSNRAFIGEVGYKGEWYKGEHEAIVSKEIFDTVQQIRRDNSYERKKYILLKAFYRVRYLMIKAIIRAVMEYGSKRNKVQILRKSGGYKT